MIVAVVGANGRSGKQFVLAALEAGFVVRAGVRGPHDLPDNENLTILACDALSKNELKILIHGSDAVVSLIGHGPGVSATVQQTATRYILQLMQQFGIRRLISLTGTGVRFAGDRPGMIDKLANRFIASVDPERIKDGKAHAELLKKSDVDWTLVRVLKLTNGSHHGRVTFSPHVPSELLTPRSRVAAGVVQLLKTDQYIKQAPVITGSE